jgi:hypothetical protein
MKSFLLAGAAALGMMTGSALAQSSGHSSTTAQTTTVTPSVAAPSTTIYSSSVGQGATADGDQTASSAWSSTDSSGSRTDTVVTNKTYPLSDMITTTRTTTVTTNGVAAETVATTNTYPARYNRPPETSTATRTYVVVAK